MNDSVPTLVTEEYLLQAISGAEKACLVAADGIQETLIEIELIAEYLNQTRQAITTLKSTDVAVSLSEFKAIKYDLSKVIDILKSQYDAIQRMNYFMKEKKREAEKLKEQLRMLKIVNAKGKVLQFPKR